MPIRKGKLWRECVKCHKLFEPNGGRSNKVCNKCKPGYHSWLTQLAIKRKKQEEKEKKKQEKEKKKKELMKLRAKRYKENERIKARPCSRRKKK